MNNNWKRVFSIIWAGQFFSILSSSLVNFAIIIWLSLQTGSAEIYLADYSDQKDSVVTKWTMFDLAKLGSVDAVDFEIISSKDAPKVFCLDVMVASVTLTY